MVAGAGGTGEATLADIVQSDEGLREYLNEAGDALESVRKVHAGDTGIYLVFKYTPVETIEDGALRFTVPSDWTAPATGEFKSGRLYHGCRLRPGV